jgi:hypothetical protein
MVDFTEINTHELNESQLSSVERQISEARMLVARLERLSADSYWAHQASGLRGALLRSIASCESWQTMPENQVPELNQASHLNRLMGRSFEILVRAAREMQR